MMIYKRRKMWWVKYQVGGVVHRQSTHTRDYKAARTWAMQIETARRMPTFDEAVEVLRMMYRQPDEGKVAIEAAWDTYLGVAKAVGRDAVAPRTLERRRLALRRFADWLAKECATVKFVEAVSGAIAAKFAAHLAGLGLKSKTRINNISDLSTVWKLLETVSPNIRNPWPALRPQVTDSEIGKAFTAADEAKVLAAAKKVGRGWFEVCTIMRHTGLRYGDVARLLWTNVDGDTLRVTPHKTARHAVAVAVPIIKPVREALATLPRTCEYVFPAHADVYGSANHHALEFREVLDAADLADAGYTVHSWRHTAATRLAQHGATIETRKAILGHTVDATARRYDHDEHLAEKRTALERASL